MLIANMLLPQPIRIIFGPADTPIATAFFFYPWSKELNLKRLQRDCYCAQWDDAPGHLRWMSLRLQSFSILQTRLRPMNLLFNSAFKGGKSQLTYSRLFILFTPKVFQMVVSSWGPFHFSLSSIILILSFIYFWILSSYGPQLIEKIFLECFSCHTLVFFTCLLDMAELK